MQQNIHFIDDLPIDHPGIKDQNYVQKRKLIAQNAIDSQVQNKVLDIEYDKQDLGTWKWEIENIKTLHDQFACQTYLTNKSKMPFDTFHVPQISEINKVIRQYQDFELFPVSGLLDGLDFLGALADNRMFCTQYLRHHSKPEYTPESDLIHELIGHSPMFLDSEYCELSREFGRIAKRIKDPAIGDKLGALYWFSVEFGLIRENGQIKAFGAGVLSSKQEIGNIFVDKQTKISDFTLEAILASTYDYYNIQNQYFVIDSMKQVIDVIREFEKEQIEQWF
jgi:phenylalanine-4-hydroxylase